MVPIAILVLLQQNSPYDINVHKGRSGAVAYEIFTKTGLPTALGLAGQFQKDSQLHVVPEIDGSLDRKLSQLADDTVSSWSKDDGFCAFRLKAFPRPYPRRISKAELTVDADSDFGKRISVSGSTVKIASLGKEYGQKGVQLSVGQLARLLSHTTIDPFLYDFELSLGFDEVSEVDLDKLVARATCGKFDAAPDGEYKISVDEQKLKEMWKEQIRQIYSFQFDPRDRELVNRKIGVKCDLIDSLTHDDVQRLIDPDTPTVTRLVPPGSKQFETAKAYAQFFASRPDLQASSRKEELKQHYTEVVAGIDWTKEILVEFRAINIVDFKYPVKGQDSAYTSF